VVSSYRLVLEVNSFESDKSLTFPHYVTIDPRHGLQRTYLLVCFLDWAELKSMVLIYQIKRVCQIIFHALMLRKLDHIQASQIGRACSIL